MSAEPRSRYEDLTPREREVISLMGRGLTNGQIAERLGIGFETVKWHVSHIMSKTDAATREDAVREWRAWNRPRARALRGMQALVALPLLAKVGLGTGAAVVAGVAVVGAAGLPGDDAPGAAADLATPTPAYTEPISDEARAALADGTVTPEELEAAVMATMACLDAAGIEHSKPVLNTQGYDPRWTWILVGQDVADESYECQRFHAEPLQMAWAAQREPDDAELARRQSSGVQCAQQQGLNVSTYEGLVALPRTMAGSVPNVALGCLALANSGYNPFDAPSRDEIELSEATKAALADGKVTAAELESGRRAMLACFDEAGVAYTEPKQTEQNGVPSWGYSATGGGAACTLMHYDPLRDQWDLQHVLSPGELARREAAAMECARGHGIDVANYATLLGLAHNNAATSDQARGCIELARAALSVD
jgi:DNA-binding CsgD family transcriptional regulator